MPAHTGGVRDVDLQLWRGVYRLEGMWLDKEGPAAGGEQSDHLLVRIERADIHLLWGRLIRGRFLSMVELEDLEVNIEAAESKLRGAGPSNWRELVRAIIPAPVHEIRLRNGSFHYRNRGGDPALHLYAQNIQAEAGNLDAIQEEAGKGTAHLSVQGNVMSEGEFTVDAAADSLKVNPSFEMELQVDSVALSSLNALFLNFAWFDMEAGTLDLGVQMNVSKGKYEGYIRPVLENIQIIDLTQGLENPLQFFWEVLVGIAGELLEGPTDDRMVIEIPLSGSVPDPETNVWAAFGRQLLESILSTVLPLIDLENQGA
jgi:hypothetical protein